MHIVQFSWLHGTTVPPTGYGGIERVVATLSQELIRQGHQVTLIAPYGSSIEGARYLPANDFDTGRHLLSHAKADIVHDHSCWHGSSPARSLRFLPIISTTHVNHAVGHTRNVVYLSWSQAHSHYEQMGIKYNPTLDVPVIRVPTDPKLKPKGLPRKDYLLFLGSVAPHKGVHRAAAVAKMLGRELIVAGPAAGEYADQLAAQSHVTLLGEVRDPQRSELLEQAHAVMCLHGDDAGWKEPGCGIVGEAGAFGTPVAALPNGCLEEIVINGVNGWIAPTIEQVASLMAEYPTFRDPGSLAREYWSAEAITKKYLDLYQSVIGGYTWG